MGHSHEDSYVGVLGVFVEKSKKNRPIVTTPQGGSVTVGEWSEEVWRFVKNASTSLVLRGCDSTGLGEQHIRNLALSFLTCWYLY
jgi:hypothetical protein